MNRKIHFGDNKTIEVNEIFYLGSKEISELFPFMKNEHWVGYLLLYNLKDKPEEVYVCLCGCLQPIKLSETIIEYFLPNLNASELEKSKELQRNLIIFALFNYKREYQLQLESGLYWIEEFVSHVPYLKKK